MNTRAITRCTVPSADNRAPHSQASSQVSQQRKLRRSQQQQEKIEKDIYIPENPGKEFFWKQKMLSSYYETPKRLLESPHAAKERK